MPEWWTYSLRDFVMFSPHTYYRLFALYNSQIWPTQLVAMLLGMMILILLRRDEAWRGRVIAGLLGMCWLWVAYAYLLERYTTIHWAGRYFAAAFAGEALLFVSLGVIGGRLPFRFERTFIEHIGLVLFVFALLLQPLIAPLAGRGWGQAEFFGVAPDPTAIGTLGLLLLAADRVPWLLLLVPAGWCALSAATLWVMASPDALVLPVAILLALPTAVWKAIRVRQHRARYVSGHV